MGCTGNIQIGDSKINRVMKVENMLLIIPTELETKQFDSDNIESAI